MPYRVRVFQRRGRGRDSRFEPFPDGGVLAVFWWCFGGVLVVAIFMQRSSPRRRAGGEPGLVFWVVFVLLDGFVVPVVRHDDAGGQDGGAVAEGRVVRWSQKIGQGVKVYSTG